MLFPPFIGTKAPINLYSCHVERGMEHKASFRGFSGRRSKFAEKAETGDHERRQHKINSTVLWREEEEEDEGHIERQAKDEEEEV